ncbi:MAG: YdcF family protein, partial [Acidimicrobiaceae bacterium]|nr:YdcF family protein [Acidimicrobiaceae bacterium]
RGVPEEDITLIPEGTNSWQQLSASAAQIETLRMDSVLLVSDGYHNYRLLAIADELGIEAYVSPSAVASTTMNVVRESAAVSIGRITGYRRLSAFTE